MSPGRSPLRRKRPRLACLGDLTVDVVVRALAPIAVGTDTAGSLSLRVGGSAANTCRAFAALGGAARFIGAVGSDELGGRLTAGLRAEGVTVHAVRVRGRSARLLALVAADGERTFVTDRGVADALAPEMLRTSWLAGIDAIHVPAYSLLRQPLAETSFTAMDAARGAGALVSVDLASRRPLLAGGRRQAREILARAAPDVLFGNEGEASAIVPGLDPERLAALAPVVVVKQGAAGCQVIRAGRERGVAMRSHVATNAIAAPDTTGAGDAFDAGFLYSLLASGYRAAAAGSASDAVLRRAALAGHRSAARLLTAQRRELLV